MVKAINTFASHCPSRNRPIKESTKCVSGPADSPKALPIIWCDLTPQTDCRRRFVGTLSRASRYMISPWSGTTCFRRSWASEQLRFFLSHSHSIWSCPICWSSSASLAQPSSLDAISFRESTAHWNPPATTSSTRSPRSGEWSDRRRSPAMSCGH